LPMVKGKIRKIWTGKQMAIYNKMSGTLKRLRYIQLIHWHWWGCRGRDRMVVGFTITCSVNVTEILLKVTLNTINQTKPVK